MFLYLAQRARYCHNSLVMNKKEIRKILPQQSMCLDFSPSDWRCLRPEPVCPLLFALDKFMQIAYNCMQKRYNR